MKSTVLTVRPVDPCFVVRNETTQKHLRIALKLRQILLYSILTIALVVRIEQTCDLSRRPISHAQYFNAGLLTYPTHSAISRIFNLPTRDLELFSH